ncbi:hypothetical protein ACFOWE_02365 [Planomonospora corallina]|uniref:Uncharacterized protein n=1 Tax=Planomonospora corallina TaxID=1806052 RepID=A0ABV8I406_9ACTN
MGTRPTRNRAVRLAAGALLAVQTAMLFASSTDTTDTTAPAGRTPLAAPDRYAPPAAGRLGPALRIANGPADHRADRRSRRNRPVWLTHAQAVRRLERNGLDLYSSGRCADRANRRCTSLEAVRTETLRGVIRLKRRSGCPVTLTGGTETGHTPGRYSHGNGYKLDVEPNACLDRHIRRTQPFRGVRSDGALLYGSEEELYARTPSHWDIVFV